MPSTPSAEPSQGEGDVGSAPEATAQPPESFDVLRGTLASDVPPASGVTPASDVVPGAAQGAPAHLARHPFKLP